MMILRVNKKSAAMIKVLAIVLKYLLCYNTKRKKEENEEEQ